MYWFPAPNVNAEAELYEARFPANPTFPASIQSIRPCLHSPQQRRSAAVVTEHRSMECCHLLCFHHGFF